MAYRNQQIAMLPTFTRIKESLPSGQQASFGGLL
jgi:hypothetical protein